MWTSEIYVLLLSFITIVCVTVVSKIVNILLQKYSILILFCSYCWNKYSALDSDAYWLHLVNMTEPCMRSGDAPFFV